MKQQHEFIAKIVECPKGHHIKLEILSGTTNTSHSINCPRCQAVLVVFSGDIRGIVPLEDP
jgi:hypothetical protein